MDDMELEVIDTLCKLNFRVDSIGYRYLKELLLEQLGKDSSRLIMRKMFRGLAIRHGTSEASVESAIRTNVKLSTEHGLKEKLNKLFGRTVVYETPSVKMTIVYILGYLRRKLLRSDSLTNSVKTCL